MPCGLQQHPHAGEAVGRRDHQREGIDPARARSRGQLGLRLRAQLAPQRALALEHAHRRRQAAPALDPRGEVQDALAAHGVCRRRPGAPGASRARARSRPWHRVQVVAHALEADRAAAVGPALHRRGAVDVLVDRRTGSRSPACPALRLMRHHGATQPSGPEQAQARVVPAEARPEGRAVAARLEVGRVVQEAVGDQEEHRHHGRDEVQARRAAIVASAMHRREQHPAPRIGRGPDDLREGRRAAGTCRSAASDCRMRGAPRNEASADDSVAAITPASTSQGRRGDEPHGAVVLGQLGDGHACRRTAPRTPR